MAQILIPDKHYEENRVLEAELEAKLEMKRKFNEFYCKLTPESQNDLTVGTSFALDFASWLGLTDEAAYIKVGEFIEYKHKKTESEIVANWHKNLDQMSVDI